MSDLKLPKGAVMWPPASHTYAEKEGPWQFAAIVIYTLTLPLLCWAPLILFFVGIFVFHAPAMTLTAVAIYFITCSMEPPRPEDRGGWGVHSFGRWYRSLWLWDEYRAYFQARLIKTSDTPYPADRNYLFCAHPFWREFILAGGAISCDRKALESALRPKDKSTGKAVHLVPGGGEEYLEMREKSIDLVLKKRKGFARMALITGASLVPVLTFGETDLFSRIDNGFTRTLSAFTKKIAHFAFPAFYGRWGTPFARRVPLTTVVGPPIHVDRVDNPTPEQVEALHAKYIESLTAIFDEYKDIFFKDRVRDLTLAQ
ncbi:Diacylglycerol O-acyltransferase 2 [Irineochytrium annulatum]|nr:Diacylglycerol O-acyltransferase 2 [Irineochytrium annulatum]